MVSGRGEERGRGEVEGGEADETDAGFEGVGRREEDCEGARGREGEGVRVF